MLRASILSATAIALLGLATSAACGDDDYKAPPAPAATTAAAATAAASVSAAAPATSAAPATAAASPSAAASAASPAASASPAAALLKAGTTGKGPALTDGAGLTLYTFDNDTAGKSACNGGCATTWPALTTTAAAPPAGIAGATGAFTLVTRDDGAKQVAYNGKPLYRYAPDRAPGDTNGDGVGGVWHIAKP